MSKRKTMIASRLAKKSFQSEARYRIAAVAFDKHGDVLGFSMNRRNTKFKPTHRGAGIHAEMQLIQKYQSKIKKIGILRSGKSGDELPIKPCENCSKIASKLGIKIVQLVEM